MGQQPPADRTATDPQRPGEHQSPGPRPGPGATPSPVQPPAGAETGPGRGGESGGRISEP